jgi:phage tail-like protein
MDRSFPYTSYHFDVSFLFPQFKFNAGFQEVSGLSFTGSGGESASETEGGNNGFSLPLTGQGSFTDLVLSRGFTADMGLYDWCEQTIMTMKTQPCNILVSLLDKESMPIKNWLIFNAFPKSWTAGGFKAGDKNIMIEKVTLNYHNFILI